MTRKVNAMNLDTLGAPNSDSLGINCWISEKGVQSRPKNYPTLFKEKSYGLFKCSFNVGKKQLHLFAEGILDNEGNTPDFILYGSGSIDVFFGDVKNVSYLPLEKGIINTTIETVKIENNIVTVFNSGIIGYQVGEKIIFIKNPKLNNENDTILNWNYSFTGADNLPSPLVITAFSKVTPAQFGSSINSGYLWGKTVDQRIWGSTITGANLPSGKFATTQAGVLGTNFAFELNGDSYKPALFTFKDATSSLAWEYYPSTQLLFWNDPVTYEQKGNCKAVFAQSGLSNYSMVVTASTGIIPNGTYYRARITTDDTALDPKGTWYAASNQVGQYASRLFEFKYAPVNQLNNFKKGSQPGRWSFDGENTLTILASSSLVTLGKWDIEFDNWRGAELQVFGSSGSVTMTSGSYWRSLEGGQSRPNGNEWYLSCNEEVVIFSRYGGRTMSIPTAQTAPVMLGDYVLALRTYYDSGWKHEYWTPYDFSQDIQIDNNVYTKVNTMRVFDTVTLDADKNFTVQRLTGVGIIPGAAQGNQYYDFVNYAQTLWGPGLRSMNTSDQGVYGVLQYGIIETGYAYGIYKHDSLGINSIQPYSQTASYFEGISLNAPMLALRGRLFSWTPDFNESKTINYSTLTFTPNGQVYWLKDSGSAAGVSITPDNTYFKNAWIDLKKLQINGIDGSNVLNQLGKWFITSDDQEYILDQEVIEGIWFSDIGSLQYDKLSRPYFNFENIPTNLVGLYGKERDLLLIGDKSIEQFQISDSIDAPVNWVGVYKKYDKLRDWCGLDGLEILEITNGDYWFNGQNRVRSDWFNQYSKILPSTTIKGFHFKVIYNDYWLMLIDEKGRSFRWDNDSYLWELTFGTTQQVFANLNGYLNYCDVDPNTPFTVEWTLREQANNLVDEIEIATTNFGTNLSQVNPILNPVNKKKYILYKQNQKLRERDSEQLIVKFPKLGRNINNTWKVQAEGYLKEINMQMTDIYQRTNRG